MFSFDPVSLSPLYYENRRLQFDIDAKTKQVFTYEKAIDNCHLLLEGMKFGTTDYFNMVENILLLEDELESSINKLDKLKLQKDITQWELEGKIIA